MEKERNPETPQQKVVRSLVVSLAKPDEIYNAFLQSKDHNPTVLRFYIAQKGNEGNRRYTLFSGKINPDENFSEAIERKIDEELGVKFLGIPWQTIIGQWHYLSPSGKREVFLTYNPIYPQNTISLGDPKIISAEVLDYDKLQELIEKGQLGEIPLEGHLAMNTQDEIFISQEEAIKRNQSMIKLLSWMSHIEVYLQKRFEQIILRNNNPISFKEFRGEYEKILAQFMTNGIKVAIKEKISKENEKRDSLIEALDSGYLGKDILYFLPDIAEHGIDWPGLEKTTEGVKKFIGFLKDVFVNFLQERGVTEEEYRNLMTDPQKTLEEKLALINSLNIFFREKLKEIFSVNDNQLNTTNIFIQNFLRDLSNEMKVADPNLTAGLYQDFTLTNEVANANFGYLLSLFLGYDTKINNEEAERLIRFEAGRQLLLLFKAMAGIKYYLNELDNVNNGKLQNAVNNFFGPIVGEEIVTLDKHTKMRIRIRQRNGKKFIVDEKPTKSFTSFLRKSLEEEFNKICDFYSLSIVFLDGISGQEEVELFINQFNEFLKNQFPDSETVIKDMRTYASEDYFSQKNKEQKISGKRSGSESSRMVRTKLLLSLKTGNTEELLELTIYPFFSIKDNFYWGWLEKIADDRNYLVRRLVAGKKGIPSLYDLLFPPKLYPDHYLHKLNSDYHNHY